MSADLRALLDLDGRDPSPVGDPLGEDSSLPSTKAPASLTVLHLDSWALRRGEQLLQDQEELRSRGLTAPALADFHACAFEPEVQVKEDCVDRLRREFLTTLLDTSDYRALHTLTRLDENASELAALALAL